MAKQVLKCPTVIQPVHYKHGDTPLVQTTQVPDAHCLPCHCLLPIVHCAGIIYQPID